MFRKLFSKSSNAVCHDILHFSARVFAMLAAPSARLRQATGQSHPGFGVNLSQRRGSTRLDAYGARKLTTAYPSLRDAHFS